MMNELYAIIEECVYWLGRAVEECEDINNFDAEMKFRSALSRVKDAKSILKTEATRKVG